MNYIFKVCVIVTLFFTLAVKSADGKAISNDFNKGALYAAMASDDIKEVELILSSLKEKNFPEKLAYEGALLMKKAGLLNKAKDKLNTFRTGRAKLEAAIKNDEENIEYYFLRLIIQEKAPKIVKYNSNLKTDTQLVRKSFNKLSIVIQQAIRDYSKKSAFLKPTDF